MHAWRPSSNPDTGLIQHTLTNDAGRSLLALVAGATFRTLRVSASLWTGDYWWSLHGGPNVVVFEHQHGVETDRWAYNDRQFKKALAHKKAVRGQHGGFSDLFVPIVVGREVAAVLVVGPFSTVRPTGEQILARWRALTGQQGHAIDAEFTAYLQTTLSVLVLENRALSAFEQLLDSFAKLVGGQERADAETNRIYSLQLELWKTRLVDEMWDAVRSMTDDRLSLVHHSPALAYPLRRLGLSRAANQVLVGLAMSSASGQEAVDDAVRRDAFQRYAVEIAQDVGDVLAGQVGDRGVVFVSAAPRSSQQASASSPNSFSGRLLLRSGGSISRWLWNELHGRVDRLSRCYQAALAAAEAAMSQNVRLVSSDPSTAGRSGSLAICESSSDETSRSTPSSVASIRAVPPSGAGALRTSHGGREGAPRGRVRTGGHRLAPCHRPRR